MRPEERDAASLWDALQAAKKIVTYVAGLSFDEYMASAITRSAVEREVTIMGEALNRLSPAAATAHEQLAIPAIVGLRNRVIHEYDKLEHERIFSIATELVPGLIAQLEEALPPIPPDPDPETF
jgi:uncharacterized protein with HEPN domain